MKIIEAFNVNDAFVKGLVLLRDFGVPQESRAGPVIVAPFPVVTDYSFPVQRVLFDPLRDANPFFHLFEALWLLAGRDDARWLDQFVRDFSERFAEKDGHMHGSYGRRWRAHFDLEGGGHPLLPDQLEAVVKLLKANPDDRRVVIQMWDPVSDLGLSWKDIPCNLVALPRVHQDRLDLTVFCRSNDMIWGAYGANAVHFSLLQEYLAARVGVKVGRYYQISNNFHAYADLFRKFDSDATRPLHDPYERGEAVVSPIVTEPDFFDYDLKRFFAEQTGFKNGFFSHIAVPLLKVHQVWKTGERSEAMVLIDQLDQTRDWVLAARQWMLRRFKS